MNTENKSTDAVATQAAAIAVEQIQELDKAERDELRGELQELALLKVIDLCDALTAWLQQQSPADKPEPAPVNTVQTSAERRALEHAKLEAMRLAATQKREAA